LGKDFNLMPLPKSGKAGSVAPPADPKEAQETDHRDPAEVEKVKTEKQKTETGKYGSPQTQLPKPIWIEMELVNKKGKPVPGGAYRVTPARTIICNFIALSVSFQAVVIPDSTSLMRQIFSGLYRELNH
jgi:hypothetical protein